MSRLNLLFVTTVLLVSFSASAVPLMDCRMVSTRIDRSLANDHDIFYTYFRLAPGFSLYTNVSTSWAISFNQSQCRENSGESFEVTVGLDKQENLSAALEGATVFTSPLEDGVAFANYFLHGYLTCAKNEVPYYFRLSDGDHYHSSVSCNNNIDTSLRTISNILAGAIYNEGDAVTANVCFVGDSRKLKKDLRNLTTVHSSLISAKRDSFVFNVHWKQCVKEGPDTYPGGGGACLEEAKFSRDVTFNRCAD